MTDADGLKKYLLGTAIALTTALIFQSGSLLWWAGCLTTRVGHTEKGLERCEQRVHSLETKR